MRQEPPTELPFSRPNQLFETGRPFIWRRDDNERPESGPSLGPEWPGLSGGADVGRLRSNVCTGRKRNVRLREEKSGKLPLISECLGEPELCAQALLVIEGNGGVGAAPCDFDGWGEAGNVPVALVDAGAGLQRPVAARPAEDPEPLVVDLSADLDAQLRAQAPADLLEHAAANPRVPVRIARLVSNAAPDSGIGEAYRR